MHARGLCCSSAGGAPTGGRCRSCLVSHRCGSAVHPPTWRAGLQPLASSQEGTAAHACCCQMCSYIKPPLPMGLLQGVHHRCRRQPKLPASSAVRRGPRRRPDRCAHARGPARRQARRARLPRQQQWRPQQAEHPCSPRSLPQRHQDCRRWPPCRPCPCCHAACACQHCQPRLPSHWPPDPRRCLPLPLQAQAPPLLQRQPRCWPCSAQVAGPEQRRRPSCRW